MQVTGSLLVLFLWDAIHLLWLTDDCLWRTAVLLLDFGNFWERFVHRGSVSPGESQ